MRATGTVAERPSAGERASGGGVAARRAILRWGVRMVRRGWRQQILVLTLLTVAVAAAIGFASAAYNLAPASGNAEFGTGNHFFRFEGPDSDRRSADIAAAREWFGTIDVIGHRQVAVPGRFEPLDYRTQNPRGPYGAPLLALREGRYPTTAGEVAATDGIADDLILPVGATTGLGGTIRTVVGIVENPSDLHDEFVLVSPSDDTGWTSATVLVDADTERVMSFRPPGGGNRQIGVRGTSSEGVFAAASVLGVAIVALLFIGLLAAAGFVVLAQRRQRQLGVLAAVGATERHLRLAVVANGAVVGAVAAVLGAVVGVAGWIAAEPRIEAAAGYRLERLDIPLWVVVAGMALAVAAATGAAWWPARVAARTSVVQALSGRPPPLRAARRSVTASALLVGAGVVSLALAGDVADESQVHWGNVGLLGAGTVATIVGILLACPLALRFIGSRATPLPIAARLALRDLARYQARSGAALAAIVMALAIPVAVVMAATAAERSNAVGNLAADQLLVRGAFDGPFVPEPTELDAMRAQLDGLAAAVDAVGVAELEVALDPGLEYEPTSEGRIAVTLVTRTDDGWRDLSLLYVATPALLAPYGLDLEALDPATDLVTVESGSMGLLGVAQPVDSDRRKVEPVTNAETVDPSYTSVPGTFVTLEELGRRGWQTVGSGRWLIQSRGPVTDEQLADARDLAAGGGITVEARHGQAGLSRLRSGATAVGVLLGLGVLAMTVGLIRSESAPELRTLTATGATSVTRRTITAVTAGALAAIGAVLGTAAAFAVLTMGYLDEPARMPVVHLLVIGIGLPSLAALAGWALDGREPTAVSRDLAV